MIVKAALAHNCGTNLVTGVAGVWGLGGFGGNTVSTVQMRFVGL